MRKTLEELINRITGTDDESLSLIEDITDTINSYEEAEDWKSKYEENDKEWREKYRARFMEGSIAPPKKPTAEEPFDDGATTIDFTDLFK